MSCFRGIPFPQDFTAACPRLKDSWGLGGLVLLAPLRRVWLHLCYSTLLAVHTHWQGCLSFVYSRKETFPAAPSAFPHSSCGPRPLASSWPSQAIISVCMVFLGLITLSVGCKNVWGVLAVTFGSYYILTVYLMYNSRYNRSRRKKSLRKCEKVMCHYIRSVSKENGDCS